MNHPSRELPDALRPGGEPESVETMAAKLPGFSREAVAQALDILATAGVLRREKLPDGTERFHYVNPNAYKLVDVPVVKQPGPDFGRRR